MTPRFLVGAIMSPSASPSGAETLFAGFGYFTKKDSKVGLGVYQEPYYLQFARKSQT